MQRIMIIGGPGSGKSTLARKLGARLALPVYHMDREVFWLPGWIERPRDDQLKQIERIVAQEAWVFDGSNSRTYHLRAARADLVIWLDPPLPLRLFRVIRRNLRQRGQSRPDMAEGCMEQLNMLPGFLLFILRTHRPTREKAWRFFEDTSLAKHRFTRLSEVEAFFNGLPQRGTAADR